MSKGIDEVRKSITRRRKLRQHNMESKASKQSQSFLTFPNEEEKHGYLPSFLDQPTTKGKEKNRFKFDGLLIKAIIALFVFLGAHFLLQTNNAFFENPKQLAINAFSEDFPFARMYMWYQETFGTPLAFTSNSMNQTQETSANNDESALPVNGTVTEPFEQNGKGILIAPDETTQVNAWKDGVVVFAGNDRETEKTIIVQHADKSKTTYGHLSSIDVHLYQFVPQNKVIGKISPTEANQTVYFSLQKNNDYMDPFQVMQVDDVP